MNKTIVAKGRVAVITGAAHGIGKAAARYFAQKGMRLCLFDKNERALNALSAELDETECVAVVGDVTSINDLTFLSEVAFGMGGSVGILMNNAGVVSSSGPWDNATDWRAQIDINLLSILHTQCLFVPKLLAQDEPAAIINLGSKEGITTPPGKAAYAVAKAGVHLLTEQLAHELRQHSNGLVTAHLLVPGFTWTPMNFPGLNPDLDDKPEEPWAPEQLINYSIPRVQRGDFYIICPDNNVTPEIDARRIRWSAEDMIQNRPALSRWHPDWADAFNA